MENLEQNETSQFLEKHGLNWGVRKENLISKESGIDVPKHNCVIRDDINTVLSVMGKDYPPYSNYELLELLFRVSKVTGFDVARAGLFGNGQKVYFQMKSDNLTLGNDLIEGYLTAINSFDGSVQLGFGASNITISCMNTFYSSFNQLDFKARHTKNMVTKVDEIARKLDEVKVEEARIFGDIKLLSQNSFDEQTKEMVIRKLFNIKKDVAIDDEEMLATRTINRINRFKIDLKSELSSKGENMWGLFSGVTKYTTHTVGETTKKQYESESKMFNFYGNRERAIFHDLVNLSNVGKR